MTNRGSALVSKFLSLFFIFFVIFSCTTIKSKEKLLLAHRNDDFIIYKNNPDEIKEKFDSKNLYLRSFFSNLCYPRSNNFFSDKSFIFPEEIVERFTEKIIDELYVGNSLYIIYKREDPISPFSRIYRTIFTIQVLEDNLRINFLEIDKNIIFGNQYTYSDSASFQEESECNYRHNLILYRYLENVQYNQSSVCSKDLFNDFSIYNFKLLKTPNLQKDNLEDRLNELNNLLKNGLINQSEYIKLRSKLLDKF